MCSIFTIIKNGKAIIQTSKESPFSILYYLLKQEAKTKVISQKTEITRKPKLQTLLLENQDAQNLQN